MTALRIAALALLFHPAAERFKGTHFSQIAWTGLFTSL